MGLTLNIIVWRDNRVVEEHTFDYREKRLIKIGRMRSTHVMIDDKAASRMHAVIELSGSKATLTDLGTLGGTWINGQRLQEKSELLDQDLVTIGSTVLQISLEPLIELPIPLPEAARRVGVPVPAPVVPVQKWMIDDTRPHVAAQDYPRRAAKDWRATDYVEVEEYDTRELVGRMTRRETKNRLGVAVLFAAGLLLLAAPISLSRSPPAPTAISVDSLLPKLVSKVLSEPAPAKPEPISYQVIRGDTLGVIAHRLLGDAGLWEIIYDANRSTLADPSQLEVGMELTIPTAGDSL